MPINRNVVCTHTYVYTVYNVKFLIHTYIHTYIHTHKQYSIIPMQCDVVNLPSVVSLHVLEDGLHDDIHSGLEEHRHHHQAAGRQKLLVAVQYRPIISVRG